KEKWVAVTLLGLLAMIQLCGAVLYGKGGNWFMFGMSLGGSVVMTICFVGTALALKIDSSFNRLEKKLDGKDQNNKDKKAG
ncbi:MAG TPA: hypothetical protein VMV86_06870, partial [Methanosarcinales archaeon]|nr:hypothetical protein [Methanosarcinales archaeon]